MILYCKYLRVEQTLGSMIHWSACQELAYYFPMCYSWVSRDVINFTGGQLQIDTLSSNRKKIFTVCVDLVFGSKCVQFREICLLQCSTIINTFWVDPHSELLKKVSVKPKNIACFHHLHTSDDWYLTICNMLH